MLLRWDGWWWDIFLPSTTSHLISLESCLRIDPKPIHTPLHMKYRQYEPRNDDIWNLWYLIIYQLPNHLPSTVSSTYPPSHLNLLQHQDSLSPLLSDGKFGQRVVLEYHILSIHHSTKQNDKVTSSTKVTSS